MGLSVNWTDFAERGFCEMARREQGVPEPGARTPRESFAESSRESVGGTE